MNSGTRSFCFVVIAVGILPATNHTGTSAALAVYPHANQRAERAADLAAQARPKGESLSETAARSASSSKKITERTRLSEYGEYAGEPQSGPSLSSLGTDAMRSAQGGQCIVFNNQAEFEAFNQEEGKLLKGVEDFEESPPGSGIAGFDDPLCGGIPTNPPIFPNGIDQLNLCVQSNNLAGEADVPDPDGENGLVFVEFGAGFGESSDIVLANNLVDSFDLIFGLPVPPDQQDNHTGVGFDTVAVIGGGTVAIRVFDKNNVEMVSAASPVDPAGSNFWGVWCSSTIGRINIFDAGGGAEGGDNIQMWVEEGGNPACGPGAGDCCDLNGNGTPGCDDEDCCNCICNCDPFCCDVSWDFNCADQGFEPGCGASNPNGLCTAECSECLGGGPVCGDGNCDAGENSCNCPADCPGPCLGCTVFDNQAEFEAFNEEEGKIFKGLENFEEVPPGGDPIIGFTDPLCGGIPNPPFDNGLDQDNLCVQANLLGGAGDVPSPHGANGLVFVEFGAGFGESSDILLANYFAESLDVMFGDPVPPDQQDNHTGVGFDVVSIFGGGTAEIRVFDKNNVEMVNTTSPADAGGSSFWGVWCSSTIGRINIFDLGGGAQGGDNIQLWVGSLCGNGVIDPGEECDPPGSVCPNGQDCLPDCTCPGPGNDNCANNIPIFDGDTAYDTTGASTDGLPHAACQFDGQTYHDIWYRYLATCTGQLTVSTCNQANYDTDLVVYDGCFDLIPCPPGDAFLLGCNDDVEGCTGFSSRLTVPVSQANCYTIRIGGFGEGDQGTAIVTLTCAECGNQICEDGEDACSCPADCPGECACTLFNNQAEFEAFNEEEGKIFKGLEDFEEVPPGGDPIIGFPDPLCGGIPNPPFDNGLDQDNLCVQANLLGGAGDVPSPHGDNGLVFVEFGAGFGESSDILLANYFAESLDVMFGDPVPPDQQDNHTGVGFDVVSIFGGGTAAIRVFDKNNVEMVSATSPADAAGSNFWGVWCVDTIGRINIFDTGGGAEGGDNIQMWLEDLGCQSDDECDDGDACTDDTCDDGECAHTPVDCSGAGEPCEDASCNPEGPSGNCNILLPAKNGTPCDDGSACTAEGVCFEGQCQTEAADCNDNGVPDCQDIDEKTSSDCDGDGVPDECELPKRSGGLCTEDCDPDCDGNGVIDSCDIATCTPESEDYPACDDCNLNEVPDGCDVDPSDPDGNGEVSDDEDEDGVPDECVGATGSGDWSGDNWGLGEQNPDFPYPDDGVGVADLSVTLDGPDLTIFADVDADIHALRLIHGASLHVTQTGEAGDLAIVASGLLEGNVLIKGTLIVGGDRTIEAAGRITIGAGGSYGPVIGLEEDVSATLMGDEITLECGGSVELQDSMNMEAEGDIILRSDDKGDCTPPDFEVGAQSSTSAGGDFVIEGDANINYDSSEPLDVGGDFDNQSTDAENFNWDDGGVRMNGALHKFEAAGEDVGPWPAGLVTNFAVGTLTLAADSTGRIVDTFDNQQDGEAGCDEALYVDLLVVGPGSVLLTEGCRVYYNTLFNEGSIPDLGKDVLQILEPCPADFNGDGIVNAADLAALLGSWGPCPGCAADFDGDEVVNAFDLAILLGAWGPCA